MKGALLVAGSLAQRPGYGGHAWVFLQYLLGFKWLGYDVLFLDALEESLCRDRAGRRVRPVDSWNLKYLADTFAAWGLEDAWSLSCGGETFGVPRQRVLEKARHSTMLLNVMGFLADPHILAAAPRRVFLDIDPGFGQMWRALGLSDIFAGHDDFVTIGENIGAPDCAIPTCGLPWITTPQPVALECWPAQPAGTGAFTTVASWRGPFGPIEYEGRTYGLRVHEFRKFFPLPHLSGLPFQVAMDIHAAETGDLAQLRQHGWQLPDPRAVAGDTGSYRHFVQQSRAELMIAKNLYVDTRSGWFSDRSICYLASGRPVLAQNTGWTHPSGAGLIGFSTLDEAVQGAREIAADYPRHSRAARIIAQDCFDSHKVLPRLLGNLRLS